MCYHQTWQPSISTPRGSKTSYARSAPLTGRRIARMGGN
jgi:hypothetical protein